MRSSRTSIVAAALLACLAVTATASAKTAPPSLVISHLSLDVQSQTTLPHTPAVATTGRLRKGKLYVATVQGTISYYAAIDYLAPQSPFIAFCGHPLSAPMFASDGGTGKVGNDAQFILAQPITAGACAADPLPKTWLNFQANQGDGWAHPRVLSARPLTRPLASHTYSYAFVGQNRSLRFELDDPDTRDDYGTLRITVRKAVGSDCAGVKWQAFAVKTRNVCLGSTAHTHGTVPTTPRVKALTMSQGPIAHVARDGDFPTATNGELPSGALDATEFARLQLGSGAAAARWGKTLAATGLRSAAISAFAGLGDPTAQSTSILLRTPADAAKVAADEVHRAVTAPPAGDTTSTSAVLGRPDATLVTFTASTPGGSGGEEIVAPTGSTVGTLSEFETPGTGVSAGQVESLEATIASR